MEPVWSDLRKLLVNRNYGSDCNLRQALEGTDEAYMFRSPYELNDEVPRAGDLVVGLLSHKREPFEAEIEIGGRVIYKLTCVPGFNLILPKTFIPLICLAFHEVKVKCFHCMRVELVYALIKEEQYRRHMVLTMNSAPWWTTLKDDNVLLFMQGMGGIRSNPPDPGSELPALDSAR